MFAETHSRRGRGCDNCPHVTNSDLLPQTDVHVDSTTKTVTERESIEVASLLPKPPTMDENTVDGMSCLWQSLEDLCCSLGENLPETSMVSTSKSGQHSAALIYMTFL